MRSADPVAVAARIARACPDFRLEPAAPSDRAGLPVLARSLKCWLISGRLADRPVVAKVLVRDHPIWRWYFEREAEIYPRLPAAIAAPELHAVDLAAGVMVLDRVAGRPLTSRRRLSHPIDDRLLRSLLDVLDPLAGWTRGGTLATAPPPLSAVRPMRQRLLEDPSAPRQWFLDGIRRCVALALLPSREAERMTAALDDYPEVAVCHGDLLPRNVMVDGDAVTLVDWECAGAHARDWDRALLWASLAPSQRPRVDDAVDDGDPAPARGLPGADRLRPGPRAQLRAGRRGRDPRRAGGQPGRGASRPRPERSELAREWVAGSPLSAGIGAAGAHRLDAHISDLANFAPARMLQRIASTLRPPRLGGRGRSKPTGTHPCHRQPDVRTRIGRQEIRRRPRCSSTRAALHSSSQPSLHSA